MAIFNSYVKFPEGIQLYTYTTNQPYVIPASMGLEIGGLAICQKRLAVNDHFGRHQCPNNHRFPKPQTIIGLSENKVRNKQISVDHHLPHSNNHFGVSTRRTWPHQLEASSFCQNNNTWPVNSETTHLKKKNNSPAETILQPCILSLATLSARFSVRVCCRPPLKPLRVYQI